MQMTISRTDWNALVFESVPTISQKIFHLIQKTEQSHVPDSIRFVPCSVLGPEIRSINFQHTFTISPNQVIDVSGATLHYDTFDFSYGTRQQLGRLDSSVCRWSLSTPTTLHPIIVLSNYLNLGARWFNVLPDNTLSLYWLLLTSFLSFFSHLKK